MAIKITEDGVVIYKNEPEVDRKLLPNIKDACGCQEQIDEINENISELQELVDTKAPAIYDAVSGTTVSFSDGADNMPVKNCVVTMEVTQEGEGVTSPENVRPIIGRTGLTVYQSGSDTSNPTEFPVTWETEVGTVYAGTMDMVSGKLTVTHEGIVLNGSENWERVAGDYPYFRLKINTSDIAVRNASICDRLPSATMSSGSNNQGCSVYYSMALGGGTFVGVRYDDAFSSEDIDSVKTWLNQNNTTVVYELLVPTETQLTTQEIRTLLGVNNIWSNAGNVEVEYLADTKLYIEKLTMPTEDDMIVDHAISANNFFMVGNTLYRATTAIASGATITVGTNAVKLSLSDALNALA